ncbi:hypothetical protein BGZ98_007387, partial [Dissophora globulifera]
MPPKKRRGSSGKAINKRSRSNQTLVEASNKRKRRTGLSRTLKPRRRNQGSDGEDDDNNSEDTEDSEQDIETVKDYEDAVRRRILTSTTNRYDDATATDQDQLVFAADLMMPASNLQHPRRQDQLRQPRVVYSLGTFSLYAIVKNFKYLATDPQMDADANNHSLQQQKLSERDSLYQQLRRRRLQFSKQQRRGARFRDEIKQLPFYISAKLFNLLKHARPELLSSKIWTTLFFPAGGNYSYPTELDLDGLISSQVTDTILRAHVLHTLQLGPQLERVNLNQMIGLSDNVVAQLVGACTRMARLSLKGCTKVGDLTLANLPGHSLRELNISFVAAPTAKGIKRLILECRELRVLKMAGVANIKDGLFVELDSNLSSTEGDSNSNTGPSMVESLLPPLHALENLKISSTKLGDRGLRVLLALCGRTLKRLDISSTNVTRIATIADHCFIQDDSCMTAGPSTKQVAQDQSMRGPSGTNSKIRTTTSLEKLNLTRLKLHSPNDLLKALSKMPQNSLHTLLMGYLSCGQVQLRDDLFNRVADLLEQPATSGSRDPGCNRTDGLQSPSPPLPASKLALRPHPFAPLALPTLLPSRQEYHLHTLSLFGNPQIGLSKQYDSGLYLLLRRLAPYLRRLELGYTSCRTSILEGLLCASNQVEEGEQVQRDIDNDDVNGDDVNIFVHDPDDATILLTDNYVLEELGLDETPMDDMAVMVLSRFRRLKRLSLTNTKIGQEAVEIVVEG